MTGRRTRAMGLSPGGAKSLDLSAPTRKQRKPRNTTGKQLPPPSSVQEISSLQLAAINDAPATQPTSPLPPTLVSHAQPGSKRKNEEAVVDDGHRPVKRTRNTREGQATRSTGASEPPATSQALTLASGSNDLAGKYSIPLIIDSG